ncbi:cellulose-binding protein [Saccharothrix sp. HUAS TT1]|uniref:cellulose-binding protein n=1 Tax=unclassified Saccharothrix TaxID=2593673 RepID=UPI00345C102F
MAVDGDLVPLRADFDVVWRGYDRRQVRRHVEAAEAELKVLAADRDAAEARADDLARQLETARAEIRALREHVDRISRTPISPAALTERLRRMAELAHEEAAEVVTRARAVAEGHWSTAERAAARVRDRSERLVAELDAQRRRAEAEHRALMEEAAERIRLATGEAERRRRELDDLAAAAREEVRVDFELAMSARRAEAAATVAEQRAAAQARAEQLVRDAEDHARRILAEAGQRVDELRARRDHIAAGLRDARRLLAEATPLLHAPLDEIPTQRTEAVPTDPVRHAKAS